ncbi:hypothetical protein NM208_g3095 [Fusarium decemcellulare]|uniref:Uncharacterized protein n=1 Tax=Fusarium decemcellulare TaxID=57161 RepID=A0ACC1SQK4_9HYPO|nr:hypothetical protein NM208_g3095 [Fusarium decemcellulare]
MRFSLLKPAIALVAASSAVMAQTPADFEPRSKNNLQVRFGGINIFPGGIEPQKDLGYPPALAIQSSKAPLYIAFMMDISVVLKPGSSPTTLIHWVRQDLRAESGGTSLEPKSVGALAQYMAPGPPPGQTHDYVVLLFEQPANFKVPDNYESYFANITSSINNRIGFDLAEFTEATGLKREPVAANWFRVSTPAQPSGSAGSTGPSPTASGQATVSTSSALRIPAFTVMIGFVGLATAFTGLGDYCGKF